jgi:ketosteroid isomerase-like protein
MNKISKEQVMLHEQRLIEAVKVSDVKTIRNMLHDDLLFLVPSGDIITKQMDLASHEAGNMIVERLDTSDYETHMHGDTAVVSLIIDTLGSIKMETQGKSFDQRMEGKFRYLRIWKHLDGRLQVISGSCIPLTFAK